MTWRRAMVALGLATFLAGCTAAADVDGEPMSPPAPQTSSNSDPVNLLVDTDLGADDLAALTFLAHHPAIRLRAITISPGGLVACADAGPVLAALAETWTEPLPPYACAPGHADGRAFPGAWRRAATRPLAAAGTVSPTTASAEVLLGDLARSVPQIHVLALGPMTGVVELLDDPELPGRHVVTAMVGATTRGDDEVAEWNAAAAPAALTRLLDLGVPLRIVPVDAVPAGIPDWLWAAPEVRGRVLQTGIDHLWDLAAAAVVVDPARCDWTYGTWRSSSVGLLQVVGAGPARVADDCSHAAAPDLRR